MVTSNHLDLPITLPWAHRTVPLWDHWVAHLQDHQVAHCLIHQGAHRLDLQAGLLIFPLGPPACWEAG